MIEMDVYVFPEDIEKGTCKRCKLEKDNIIKQVGICMECEEYLIANNPDELDYIAKSEDIDITQKEMEELF